MSVDQGGDERSILIDLDVLRVEPELRQPRSGGRLLRRRWLLVTAVLLLVAGLLTGADRRRDLAPVFQLSGEAQQAQISDGVLFVSPQLRSLVRAYSIPQGRLLWSHQSTVGDGPSEWRAYGDVLVLSLRNSSGGLKNLEALDGRTGRSLWRVDRAALVGGVGNTLVIGRLSTAGAASEAGGVAGALVGLDRRTGAELWSQPLSIVDLATVVGDTASDSDTRSGAEASAASGAGSSAGLGAAAPAAPRSGAGYVVVTGADGSARAYDARSGRPVSDAEVAAGLADGRSLGDIVAAGGAGDFVGLGACTVLLYGAVANQRWRNGACLPDSVLRRVAEQAQPGRYFEFSGSDMKIMIGRGDPLQLFGKARGDGAGDLHGWARVGSVAGGRRLVLAAAEAAGGGGRTVLALLDSTGRTPTVLGRESRAIGTPTCHGDDRYLVCRGVLGLGVWRLPHAGT